MQVLLKRIYMPPCTVGSLFIDGKFHSHTLELVWKDNKRRESCIPEGEYELKKYRRLSGKMAIEVCGVPNRTAILFHAGNDATQDQDGADTQGCILPNAVITMANQTVKGAASTAVTNKLFSAVFAALDRGEKVQLVVSKA
jgi:hypothetical protein